MSKCIKICEVVIPNEKFIELFNHFKNDSPISGTFEVSKSDYKFFKNILEKSLYNKLEPKPFIKLRDESGNFLPVVPSYINRFGDKYEIFYSSLSHFYE